MKIDKPIKLRNKISQTEMYYTYSHWPSKDIDGVEFLPVVKQVPSQTNTQTIHYMRKDSLEKVKA
jgi:hypothetical protein